MKRLSGANKVVVLALIPVLVGAVLSVAQAATAQPNALDFYVRAIKASDGIDQEQDFIEFADPKLKASKAAIAWRKSILARNAKSLSLLRQGFAYPYLQPAHNEPDGFSMGVDSARELASLLVVEADTYEAGGQCAEAISDGLDAVRLGTDLARGDLSALMTGLAVEGEAFGILKKSSIEKLDAHSAQVLARRLETLDAHRFSYTQTLQNEKMVGLNNLQEIFRTPNWRKNLPTTQTPQQITTTYERLMDETIINVALPYPQRRGISVDGADAVSKTIFGTLASKDATQLSTTGSGSFYENLRALSRLAATTLALRAFKVEHGHYPAALAELAPQYLRRVPMDPFSNLQPLHYKTTGIEYSLYSIGPDSKDDGGKQGQSHFRPDDKGDIVAGVDTR